MINISFAKINRHTLIIFSMLFCVISFGQNYKMMTYNIRYATEKDGENQWSYRKDFLSEQIAFYEPDIFGVQEGLHHQVNYLNSKLLDYSFVGIGRDDGKEKGEYSAIFYKSNSLEVLEQNTFWLSDTPDNISVGWDASMERICTYALFKDKNSKQKFWVFNTHFDHRGEKARVKSSELIIKKINELNTKQTPVVLMGDLNLLPTSEPIQFLTKNLFDSRSVSQSKPFGPEGTFNGFKFNEPIKNRIDYIFVSKKNIEVKKYAVLTDSKNFKYPSDHLPVIIEVEMLK